MKCHALRSFTATDFTGRTIRSADFDGRLRALLFISTSCRSCTTTIQELHALGYKAQGNLLLVCRASHDECSRFAATLELQVPVIVDEDERLSHLFDISSVPMAVLINAHNRIQSYGYPFREELELLTEPNSEKVAEVDQDGTKTNL